MNIIATKPCQKIFYTFKEQNWFAKKQEAKTSCSNLYQTYIVLYLFER